MADGKEEKWIAEVLKANEASRRGPSSSSASPPVLPRSVRNQPEGLRADIRRYQNRESARRAREKYKKEDEKWAEDLRRQHERLQGIEARLGGISRAVEGGGRRKEQSSDRRSRNKSNGGGSSSRHPGRK